LRVNSSRSKLYSELGWEPLYKRREKQKLILHYKIINGLTPDYMYDMIQPYTETIHDYNLRQQISGDNFRLPFCNTVSYSKSFIPCTLRLWNGLPASTKTSPSLNLSQGSLQCGQDGLSAKWCCCKCRFRLLASFVIWQCMIFSFLSPIWKYLGEAIVPECSIVLNILREGLDFVEAGRPFQSRNVQGMKLLLYETVLQKGSLKFFPRYLLS
jgi:hypothetical protein